MCTSYKSSLEQKRSIFGNPPSKKRHKITPCTTNTASDDTEMSNSDWFMEDTFGNDSFLVNKMAEAVHKLNKKGRMSKEMEMYRRSVFHFLSKLEIPEKQRSKFLKTLNINKKMLPKINLMQIPTFENPQSPSAIDSGIDLETINPTNCSTRKAKSSATFF